MRQIFSALLLFRVIQSSFPDNTQVTFRDSEYIAYNLKPRSIAGFQFRSVQLKFRTRNPTGLLLYSRGSSGDYIHLFLVEGTLRFKSYIGGKHQAEINLGSNLSDGEWHSVNVLRTDRKTVLHVDNLRTTHVIDGSLKRLLLNDCFYLGGLSNNAKKYFPKTDVSTFTGCLSDVQLNNDFDFLKGAQQKTSNFTVSGDVVFQCNPENYSPVTFISRLSYVKFVLQPSVIQNALVIRFEFRTYIEDGLIISRSAFKVKMYLKLKQSSLHLNIIAPRSSILLKTGNNLANGNWYKVVANISASLISLQLNNEFAHANVNNESKKFIQKFCNAPKVKIYVGRHHKQQKHLAFVGCLLNLQVNTHKIQSSQFTRATYMKGVMSNICQIKNNCFPNKCQNEGKCQQNYVSFSCDCSGIEYEGFRCEIPIYRRNCAEYKDIGLVNDSYCLLRSSGKETRKSLFTALCKITRKGRTTTVVKHTKMKETAIQLQSARVTANLYSHTFQYQASRAQVKELIDDSLHCRQYIRFDCKRMLAQWVGRDGKNQSFRGNTIISGSRTLCAWSFIDKHLLPVQRLLFRTSGRQSYFNLTALECWGQKHQPAVIIPRPHLLEKACVPIKPSPTPIMAYGTTVQPHVSTTNDANCTTNPTVSITPSLSVPLPSSTSMALAAQSYLPTKATTERKPDVTVQPIERESKIVLSTTVIVVIVCVSFIIICIGLVCLYARRWDDLPLDWYDDHNKTPKKVMLEPIVKQSSKPISNGHIKTGQGSNGQLSNQFAVRNHRSHSADSRISNAGLRFTNVSTKNINRLEENANDINSEDESSWV